MVALVANKTYCKYLVGRMRVIFLRCLRPLGFILKLIERMFKFLTHIRSMAKTEGYAISKVEIKIPSIRCEFVNIFFGTIPIPQVSSS